MKWKTLAKKELFSSGLFRLTSQRCELADKRIMPNYYVIEFADWVNVIPVTPDGQVILVKQYRHASGLIHLELPGGSLDPRLQESNEQGARREMLEETGFDSNEMSLLTSHYPNPALQTNQMHCFFAFNAFKKQEQKLDEFEELSLYFCSIEKLEEHYLNGDINHSLMLASLGLALPILKEKFKR
jgi:ADP-ribose pyrophosphatase